MRLRMQGWCILNRISLEDRLFKRLIVARFGRGAGLAKDLAICAAYVPIVVDSLTADCAGDTLRFVARHLTWMNRHTYPLLAEEVEVWKLAIGKHLLLVLVLDIRVKLGASGRCRKIHFRASALWVRPFGRW